MARSTFVQDREMLEKGYVSAAVACVQYGVTRAQLLDMILDGKVGSRKPSASIYVKWVDMLREMGKPAEYRATQRGDVPVGGDLPMLDGMIPIEELESEYRATVAKRGRPRTPRSARSKPSSFALNPGEHNEELE